MDSFLRSIKVAWSTSRPRYVAYLENRDALLPALEYAAAMMAKDASDLMKEGMSMVQAVREAKDRWMHLPDEKTQPVLSSDLAIYGQPDLTMQSRGTRIAQ